MKKIGLITLFKADNYGTCLQAFALQTLIDSMGYQCDIIDYNLIKNNYKKKLKNISIVEVLAISIKKIFITRRKAVFAKFRDEMLNITACCYDKKESFENIDNIYTAFVCGSDMIWSPECQANYNVFFLQFTKSEKRIAYAPSIGQARLNVEQEKIYRELIKDFQFLSCREENTAKELGKLTEKKVTFVLDPTLLLLKEQWRHLFRIKQTLEPCILCYMFRKDRKALKKLTEKVEHMTQLNTRWIPSTFKEYLNELQYGVYGPVEFVTLFQQAQFVITDSYHGLLFSLIFEKPFILIHREHHEYWSKYEERMEALLRTLQLSERYCFIEQDFPAELLELNYEEINKKLRALREISVSYLENALKNIANLEKDKCKG